MYIAYIRSNNSVKNFKGVFAWKKKKKGKWMKLKIYSKDISSISLSGSLVSKNEWNGY